MPKLARSGRSIALFRARTFVQSSGGFGKSVCASGGLPYSLHLRVILWTGGVSGANVSPSSRSHWRTHPAAATPTAIPVNASMCYVSSYLARLKSAAGLITLMAEAGLSSAEIGTQSTRRWPRLGCATLCQNYRPTFGRCIELKTRWSANRIWGKLLEGSACKSNVSGVAVLMRLRSARKVLVWLLVLVLSIGVACIIASFLAAMNMSD